MKVDCHTCITIPIRNPDKRFADCIKSLSNQAYAHSLSIFIISSGHDESLVKPIVNAYQDKLNILIKEISPFEFQHGRTRNIAVQHVRASYYVFITQDAVPADTRWLHELVSPLETDQDIAGSYSRHVAHPEHSLFCKAELEHFFSRLSQYPLVDSAILNRAESQADTDLMTFFSNNSSCIRGTLFRTCAPFPEVDFAEDQAWSIRVLDTGYKKAFCYKSVICHSHSLSIREAFGRGLDEAMSFRENHGRRIMGRNPFNVAKSTLALCSRDGLAMSSLNTKTKLDVFKAFPSQLMRRVSQSAGTFVGSSSTLSRIFVFCSRDKILNKSKI
jgi:rhamnosyltransferase